MDSLCRNVFIEFPVCIDVVFGKVFFRKLLFISGISVLIIIMGSLPAGESVLQLRENGKERIKGIGILAGTSTILILGIFLVIIAIIRGIGFFIKSHCRGVFCLIQLEGNFLREIHFLKTDLRFSGLNALFLNDGDFYGFGDFLNFRSCGLTDGNLGLSRSFRPDCGRFFAQHLLLLARFELCLSACEFVKIISRTVVPSIVHSVTASHIACLYI